MSSNEVSMLETPALVSPDDTHEQLPRSLSPFSRPVPDLFKAAFPESAPHKEQELPATSGEGGSSDDAPELPPDSLTGAPLERFNAIVIRNFVRLDSDRDGSITEKELQGRRVSMVNKDELQMLAWLNKNIGSLEYLGDFKPGFGRKDLDGFNRANEQGSGSLKFALRDYDVLFGAIGSVAGGGIYGWLTQASSLKKAGAAALIFAGSAAVHAGIYYLKDRPKIDCAINELNGLPNLADKP